MATMKDVARLAGVSTSTVSHVINKDRFVSEAITAKVEAAIKELNYAPSALARSLKLNQTHTIGMLITASTNPFYSELVRGVERSCFERGYSLVLCNTEGDEQRMNRNLESSPMYQRNNNCFPPYHRSGSCSGWRYSAIRCLYWYPHPNR